MSAAGIVEHRRGRVRWLSADLLERRDVRHGFTLRAGGASRGAFASLNFSSREGDLPERVRENWRRLEAAARLPARGWALLSQVHGARVERIDAGGASCHHRRSHPEADAMASDRPGLALGVLTADCLPVVLAVPGSGAAAIAHAGWRGTLEGVIPAAVGELCTVAAASPADVFAALGPAIGPCCYRVGDEVREAFRARWGSAHARSIFARGEGWSLDLQAANLRQLREAGVPARGVAALPFCTSCRADLFFSYRRDGQRSGRMLNFVATAGASAPDADATASAGHGPRSTACP
ncbi:MAG TPA: peptidoglycan editing factor PgeF [Candidatus Methanoperedens sp.]|nr:peptidoglycan editing factor PgeF [Candidatus Methanoperedens sp.]